MRPKKTMRGGAGAAAAAALLVLAACGSADVDSDDPEVQATTEQASTEEPTPEQTSTEEPTPEQTSSEEPTPEATPGDTEWGDGVWPEGISFELPDDVALQDDVTTPGRGEIASGPYRQLTMGSRANFEDTAASLFDSGFDPGLMRSGLDFAATFYIENVMDSPLLTQRYTVESLSVWMESVEGQALDSFFERISVDSDEVEKAPYAVSLHDTMDFDWVSDNEDARTDSGDEAYELLHEDGGSRLANVEVALGGSHWNPDAQLLSTTFDSAQTILFDSTSGAPYASTFTFDGYHVDVSWDGEEWRVWHLVPGVFAADTVRLDGRESS